MTAEQLKNSILQMAVQGKLVPQDPNDEPASELIKRIREEKENLIKEGKIKKEKNPSYIFRGEDNIPYEKVGKNEPVSIADEVPFEIPESWEWVKLKSLGAPVDDAFADGPFGSNLKKEHYTEEHEVRLIQLSNIGDEGWKDANTKYTTYMHAQTLSRSMVKPGCIVIAKMMPAGRAIIVPDLEKDYILSSDAVKFIPNERLDVEYLLFAINSPAFRNQVVAEAHGVTRVRTSLGKLQTYYLPIPPLKEQKKIVQQIKNIYPLIKKYESGESKRLELDSLFSDMLKKSILQEAVMGKLVPQDPNDEPASVLLEKIRAEKQRLIAEGKLKKDKHESIIYRRDNSHYEKLDGAERCIDDEIPWEIPDSWEWCRLKSLASVLGGKRIPAGRKLTTDNTGHIYIRISDMKNGSVLTDNLLYVPDDIYPSISRYTINKEDIYITVAGTIGSIGKIPAEIDGANLTENADRLVITNIDQDWLILCLQSGLVQNQIAEATTKVGQPKLAIKRIEELLIALPPINEQRRIVAKHNTVTSTLESL